ncbi:beta-N-acetylhexosaminidase [Streptomyces corynorhini]|uniref:beta-N-acetylhexosaminidase n=1 Tax=Streptomyces corynorhini TaxID=2282652 RepID=A0A370BBN2_9ACTN|nr:beta-N-acetylhexosaminidase [Streptomyces corynorhini]RDG37584.1 beta-N-acetylhexosaminidase [Streptomyces corynorhini]
MDLIPEPLRSWPAPRGGATGAAFPLDAETAVEAGTGTEGVARWWRTYVGAATGLPFPDASGATADNLVVLEIDPAAGRELGPEGYRITVDDAEVRVAGGSAAGVFWGAQTLRQLLGADAFRAAPTGAGRQWSVPTGVIEDAPRFAWRGLMLDVSRHFTPKDGVLRQLDLLAAHKLNVFHFHLTDDQGWRIEIESHPKLTEIGAWRARTRWGHRASELWEEKPHGGYYTKADLREIVAYAAERHITVVPEIEIPGHSQAAIAAYPELGNADVPDADGTDGADGTGGTDGTFGTGGGVTVWDSWGVSPHVLAPTAHVLRFYEDVFEEVLDVFPAATSPFIHVGGDECPKDQWRASPAAQARIEELGLADEDALQAWFIRHFDRWLAARGRRLIGWDEILEGINLVDGAAESGAVEGGTAGTGLSPGAAVSSWRGYAGGIAAAKAGHDVVMCPEQQVYLDHRQAPGDDEPMPIGYVRTLEDIYRFEPVPPQLTPEEAAHVLGTQANVWTEVMQDRSRVDYQVFPRLAAFAEVAWSALPAPGERDFADFEQRMAEHYRRLDALGVEYRPPGGPLPWQRRPGVLGRPREGTPPVG